MQKVAVIGMGVIGNLHASLYQEMDGARLVAVCDTDRARADAAATRFGVPAFYSVAELVRSCDLSMVSVATGGHEYGSDHFQPTMEALAAGLHVLGEKPICNEIDRAREMVQEAARRGLCYGINLNHRFTPAARLAKRWIDEGRIGHQLFVNVSMWIMNPRESSPWFQIKALHPHTVNIIHHFCGPITEVHCFTTTAPGRTIHSTAQFNFRLASGAVGHLCGSYDIERGHPMERVEVAGTLGRFVIDDIFREATLFPAGNLEKSVFTNPIFGGFRDFSDTFRQRLTHFVTELNSGVPPESIDGSGAEGLEAQRVLEAAVRSIRERRVVAVDEV